MKSDDSAHCESDQFAIIGNVIETDRYLRTGAKVWILGGAGGEGFDRLHVYGMTRGSRMAEKWVPTHRLGNLRAVFCPEHLRARFRGYPAGLFEDKKQATVRANELEDYAEKMRVHHLNRRYLTNEFEKD